MAKKATKSPESSEAITIAEVERTYTFPELGIAVKARGLDAATKAANKKAKEK